MITKLSLQPSYLDPHILNPPCLHHLYILSAIERPYPQLHRHMMEAESSLGRSEREHGEETDPTGSASEGDSKRNPRLGMVCQAGDGGGDRADGGHGEEL
jgi:hypothetical protein